MLVLPRFEEDFRRARARLNMRSVVFDHASYSVVREGFVVSQQLYAVLEGKLRLSPDAMFTYGWGIRPGSSSQMCSQWESATRNAQWNTENRANALPQALPIRSSKPRSRFPKSRALFIDRILPSLQSPIPNPRCRKTIHYELQHEHVLPSCRLRAEPSGSI